MESPHTFHFDFGPLGFLSHVSNPKDLGRRPPQVCRRTYGDLIKWLRKMALTRVPAFWFRSWYGCLCKFPSIFGNSSLVQQPYRGPMKGLEIQNSSSQAVRVVPCCTPSGTTWNQEGKLSAVGHAAWVFRMRWKQTQARVFTMASESNHVLLWQGWSPEIYTAARMILPASWP